MSSVKKTEKKGRGNPNIPPGPGRPKGQQNKITSDVKAMILEALGNAGGAKYLEHQAHENPNAFLSLIGKVLPMTVQGDPNAPLKVNVTLEIVGN